MRWGARVERRRSATQARRASGSPSLALVEHDHGRHRLAPLLVGHPDHGGVGHGGVHEEHLLDLARREVLPAPDDHVVEPALDEEVALRVEPAPVVGGQPAVGRQRRPRAQVLARDLVAPHPDLAVGAGRDRPAHRVADLDLEAGQRPARPSPAGAAPPGRSS